MEFVHCSHIAFVVAMYADVLRRRWSFLLGGDFPRGGQFPGLNFPEEFYTREIWNAPQQKLSTGEPFHRGREGGIFGKKSAKGAFRLDLKTI